MTTLLTPGAITPKLGGAKEWWSLVVISKRRLREHWEMPGRRNSQQPLQTWFDVARKATWKDLDDLKAQYGAKVDLAYGKYVFDIKGNDYRLVCSIDFVQRGVLVLWVGTHEEYDKLNERKGKGLKAL